MWLDWDPDWGLGVGVGRTRERVLRRPAACVRSIGSGRGACAGWPVFVVSSHRIQRFRVAVRFAARCRIVYWGRNAGRRLFLPPMAAGIWQGNSCQAGW